MPLLPPSLYICNFWTPPPPQTSPGYTPDVHTYTVAVSFIIVPYSITEGGPGAVVVRNGDFTYTPIDANCLHDEDTGTVCWPLSNPSNYPRIFVARFHSSLYGQNEVVTVTGTNLDCNSLWLFVPATVPEVGFTRIYHMCHAAETATSSVACSFECDCLTFLCSFLFLRMHYDNVQGGRNINEMTPVGNFIGK